MMDSPTGIFGRLTARISGALQRKALILMYHSVADVRSDPFSICVTPRHFAEHLEVLRRSSRMVRLQELAQGLTHNNLPRRSVAITFDDGYANNLHTVKPLLECYDIPATVFVTTGYLEHEREFWWDELERILEPGALPATLRLRINGTDHQWALDPAVEYDDQACQQHGQWRFETEAPTSRHTLFSSLWKMMQPMPEAQRRIVLDELGAWAGWRPKARAAYRTLTPEEVATLAREEFVDIGAHTVTHPVLCDLPADAQDEEIRQSKKRLEGITGQPVKTFAYPYGALTAESVAIVRKGGFDCACSTVAATVGHGADCCQLPRVQVDDWDGNEFGERLTEWFHQ